MFLKQELYVSGDTIWNNLYRGDGVYKRLIVPKTKTGRLHLGMRGADIFFFSFVFFVLQRAFFYILCTVSGCDGGNRTRNIAVNTWRFSPLNYGRMRIWQEAGKKSAE